MSVELKGIREWMYAFLLLMPPSMDAADLSLHISGGPTSTPAFCVPNGVAWCRLYATRRRGVAPSWALREQWGVNRSSVGHKDVCTME